MSEAPAPADSRWDSWRLLVEWQKDPEATLLRLRRAANAGDVRAQFLLGQIHCEGRGVPVDAGEGLHWYRLAAHAGDAMAMNMVGRCHELGWGTDVDESLAAAWYRKAALGGLDWGMYNYANLLATGRGLARNRREALHFYSEAAQMGHAKSMNLVGRYLEEGWEVLKDTDAAMDWYRRSAESGDFRGQASYAHLLAGQGRVGEAVEWLERALEGASPAFLGHLARDLAQSPHSGFRAIAHRASQRMDRTRTEAAPLRRDWSTIR